MYSMRLQQFEVMNQMFLLECPGQELSILEPLFPIPIPLPVASPVIQTPPLVLSHQIPHL